MSDVRKARRTFAAWMRPMCQHSGRSLSGVLAVVKQPGCFEWHSKRHSRRRTTYSLQVGVHPMTDEWLAADRVLVQIKKWTQSVTVTASCKQRRGHGKEKRGARGGEREEAGEEMKEIIKQKQRRAKSARKVLEALAELRCECLLGTFPRGTASYAPSKSNKGCNWRFCCCCCWLIYWLFFFD